MAYRTAELPSRKDFDTPSEGSFCYLCGKKLKGRNDFQIHVVDGGGVVLHRDDEALYEQEGDPSADLGGWNIGPDCAKKIDSDFVTKAKEVR